MQNKKKYEKLNLGIEKKQESTSFLFFFLLKSKSQAT